MVILGSLVFDNEIKRKKTSPIFFFGFSQDIAIGITVNFMGLPKATFWEHTQSI